MIKFMKHLIIFVRSSVSKLSELLTLYIKNGRHIFQTKLHDFVMVALVFRILQCKFSKQMFFRKLIFASPKNIFILHQINEQAFHVSYSTKIDFLLQMRVNLTKQTTINNKQGRARTQIKKVNVRNYGCFLLRYRSNYRRRVHQD